MNFFDKLQRLFNDPKDITLKEQDLEQIRSIDFKALRETVVGKSGEINQQNRILGIRSLIFFALIIAIPVQLLIITPLLIAPYLTTDKLQAVIKLIDENNISREEFIGLGESINAGEDVNLGEFFKLDEAIIKDSDASQLIIPSSELMDIKGDLSQYDPQQFKEALGTTYDFLTNTRWVFSNALYVTGTVLLFLFTFLIVFALSFIVALPLRFFVRLLWISVQRLFGRAKPTAFIKGRLFLIHSPPSPNWVHRGLAASLFGTTGWSITFQMERNLLIRHQTFGADGKTRHKYRAGNVVFSGYLSWITGCDTVGGSPAAIEALNNECRRQGFSIVNNQVYYKGSPHSPKKTKTTKSTPEEEKETLRVI